MKKEKRFPNFQDLYSFQDYKLVQNALNTFKCGISPIYLCAPDQHYEIFTTILSEENAGYANLHIRTLKLEYAIQVWLKAALISSKNPGPLLYYWWISYEDNDTSFRELQYSEHIDNATPQCLNQSFWKLLEDIANSGKIWVHEGYSFGDGASEELNINKPYITCHVRLNVENAPDYYNKIGDVFNYPYDVTPRTYTWDQIKDMFVELNLHQLSLTSPERLHKYTSIDELLFNACDRLDIDDVKKAVRLGANVNALDKRGESALQHAIAYFTDHGFELDKQYSKEEETAIIADNYSKCVEIVDYLLDQGADIDLFGVGGLQPIVEAYYAHSFDMIKHLLEKGSDPNYNSFRGDDVRSHDEDSTHCTILQVIDNLLYDEYDDFAEKTDELLHQYGARLYDWDLDVAREIHIGKYYISISPSSPKYLFYDNSWAIGNEDEITIEDADGNKTTLKLQKVESLKEWHDEYTQNIEKPFFDWKEWRARGFKLAQQVAKQLPETVALYFPYDEDPQVEYFSLENRHYLRSLSEKILVTP